MSRTAVRGRARETRRSDPPREDFKAERNLPPTPKRVTQSRKRLQARTPEFTGPFLRSNAQSSETFDPEFETVRARGRIVRADEKAGIGAGARLRLSFLWRRWVSVLQLLLCPWLKR